MVRMTVSLQTGSELHFVWALFLVVLEEQEIRVYCSSVCYFIKQRSS